MFKDKKLLDECFSEIIGTFILITFGIGVVASVVIAGRGNSIAVDLSWGLAVAFGAMTAKKSGGHLNPAVTVGLWLGGGKFAGHKVIPYIISQMIGAFLGAALVFTMYYPTWMIVDPDLTQASVFATVAAPGYSTMYAIFDQVVETFFLLFGIIIIGNNIKSDNGGFLGPILVGLLVTTIGFVFCTIHGYAINPARDLAPRIFTYLAGFQSTGFANPADWLAPIVGPLIGGVLGVYIANLVTKEFQDVCSPYDKDCFQPNKDQ